MIKDHFNECKQIIRFEMSSSDTINVGDYAIIERQNYTKLHKMKENGSVNLGQFNIVLDNCIGNKYEDTFRMKLITKKTYELEKVERAADVLDLNREQQSECGKDNRDIEDNGTSQNLSKEDIMRFQETESLDATAIVGRLIENSSTFHKKTEYSQEKYMRKKERKYYEYVRLRKPSIRLLAQMFYRQDPSKTLGLRVDDLALILANVNAQSDGNYLLYDSGTSGLMTAAILNAIGANTHGHLVHLHPGNECQRNAFMAMQFPEEQAKRCINVNLYSVLRCYYQNKKNSPDGAKEETETTPNASEEVDDNDEPAKKRAKHDAEETQEAKKPIWHYENERACEIMRQGIDGIVIVSKEHPIELVRALKVFLKGSRNLVVFNLYREPLKELYAKMKSECDFVSIRLTNNFVRRYQVLSERTHPEVNMTNGGYILTAYKLTF